MSDESPRPTPGNRPDQRRGRDAVPAWWAELERLDLPEDTADRQVPPAALQPPPAQPAPAPVPPPRAAAAPPPPGPAPEHHRRGLLPLPAGSTLRTAAVTVLVLVIAALIVSVALGVTSPGSAVAAVVIFGVPALLSLITASLILRRGRHG